MQRLSPDRAQGPQYGHCFLIKHLTLSQPTHSYHTTKAPSLSLSFPPSLSLPPSLPPPPFLPLLPLPLHRPCSAHLVPITCLADHMSCTEREGGREGGRERPLYRDSRALDPRYVTPRSALNAPCPSTSRLPGFYFGTAATGERVSPTPATMSSTCRLAAELPLDAVRVGEGGYTTGGDTVLLPPPPPPPPPPCAAASCCPASCFVRISWGRERGGGGGGGGRGGGGKGDVRWED